MPHISKIDHDRLKQARDAFELGLKNATQIAGELGVSRQTVTRYMAKVNAVKACRVHEVAAEVDRELDRQAMRKLIARIEADREAARRALETTNMIDRLVKAILHADRLGSVVAANGVIAETAARIKVLGR